MLTHKVMMEFMHTNGSAEDKPVNTYSMKWSQVAANAVEFGERLMVKGPLDMLFPKIVEQVQSVQNYQDQVRYVNAVKDNIILPFNISMLHFFASENNGLCVQKCFDLEMKYSRDIFGQSPLSYASQ